MKKFFVVIAILCTIGISATHAQRMQEGNSLLNLGPGFFRGLGFSSSFDYGLVDHWGPGLFTVGGFVGFNQFTTGEGIFAVKTSRFAISPRATYRLPVDDSFEVYGTLMLGTMITSTNISNDKTHFGEFFGTTVGIRYSFTSSISAFSEIGFSTTYIVVGLSISL